MPTYQYSCTECGHFFEIVQSFSEDSLTVCPVCEGRLRKVFNAVGVVFKGSGFYRNDSRGTDPGATSSMGGAEKGSDKGGADKGSGTGSDKTAKSAEKSSTSTSGASPSGGSGSSSTSSGGSGSSS